MLFTFNNFYYHSQNHFQANLDGMLKYVNGVGAVFNPFIYTVSHDRVTLRQNNTLSKSGQGFNTFYKSQ